MCISQRKGEFDVFHQVWCHVKVNRSNPQQTDLLAIPQRPTAVKKMMFCIFMICQISWAGKNYKLYPQVHFYR